MMVMGTSSTYVLWSKKKNIFVQDWTFLRNRCTKFANLAIFSSITKIVKSLPNWTKNICRSIFATPLEMLNSKFFWVGSLPNSAQGIFDYDKNCTAKGAAALFFRLLLPSHSQKFLVLNLEEIPLEKVPKFPMLVIQLKWAIFSSLYRVERQK